MNPILRNILAVLAGYAAFTVLNIGLILLGLQIIPMPEGIDPMDPESIKAGMKLFSLPNFIVPFIAHAGSTLVGAFTAAMIGIDKKMILAYIIGGLALMGGISAVYQIGGPIWFQVLDLVVAYIPMAYLGGTLATRK